MMKRESTVKVYGIPGTYETNIGGVGFGYKIAGIVYKSGADRFYYAIDVDRFIPDGGKKYMDAVKSLSGYKTQEVAKW